jgi:platelet-activating factor acetylhydrolase IB subunit alpha
MLDYLYANNFTAAYNALKEDAGTEYTPDPKAKYTGLLEKKWTSVIRLQKKVPCSSRLKQPTSQHRPRR